EQDDLVALAARGGELEVLVPHDPHAQRVDQRVPRVAGIEAELAADVGQAEAVAVEGDAADDAGQHAGGVGRAGGAEPQRVHRRHRAGAHGQDVADDPAHAGGRALERLHVGRVVVRLDLEGDRVPLADVDHARVLPDPGQQRVAGWRLVRELAQVQAGRPVGAVLAPQDRGDAQLAAGGPAAQHLLDPLVLVAGRAQVGVRRGTVAGGGRPGHGVGTVRAHPGGPAGAGPHAAARAHPATSWRTAEVKNPSPSLPGPVSGSIACSGWGMSPTTLPAALRTPAMSRAEPFGLPSLYLTRTWPRSSRAASVAAPAR